MSTDSGTRAFFPFCSGQLLTTVSLRRIGKMDLFTAQDEPEYKFEFSNIIVENIRNLVAFTASNNPFCQAKWLISLYM